MKTFSWSFKISWVPGCSIPDATSSHLQADWGEGGVSVGHLPLAGVHHGVIARDASLVQGVLKKVVQSGNPKTKHLSILKLQTFELTTIAHEIS